MLMLRILASTSDPIGHQEYVSVQLEKIPYATNTRIDIFNFPLWVLLGDFSKLEFDDENRNWLYAFIIGGSKS